ncbi:MAG: hypothetical protein HN842_08300, partial [Gammaproteobacteria bacterium]|nr:hypothetical protein [Gammaproteobacteria bacterium]
MQFNRTTLFRKPFSTIPALTSALFMAWGGLANANPISAEETGLSEPVRISAIGYGAESAYEGYTDGQRMLTSIRASKMDAYRALSEQIYGVRVNGSTTVSSMVAKNDHFRVYVDAYL